VAFYGAFGYYQPGGYLTIGFALRHQRCHLSLAPAEAAEGTLPTSRYRPDRYCSLTSRYRPGCACHYDENLQ
jgi:hypothetical protein